MRRSADSFRIEVDSHLDAVGNFDKRNSFVHPMVLTVEGHCPFDRSCARPVTLYRKRQRLLLRYATCGKVAVEYDRIGTGLRS